MRCVSHSLPSPDRDDGSALDRLQLLSQLLLETDSKAEIDVSAAGEHAYELHAITLNGRTMRGGLPAGKNAVRCCFAMHV